MRPFTRQALYLTEQEVKYAIRWTNSNAAAARFLGIHIDSWRLYAKSYIDVKTGKSLYELHKNQFNVNRKTNRLEPSRLLSGNKKINKFKGKIIHRGLIDERCDICGFDDRRKDDYQVPLILQYLDGDKKNKEIANLRLICQNCYLVHFDSHRKIGSQCIFSHTPKHEYY